MIDRVDNWSWIAFTIGSLFGVAIIFVIAAVLVGNRAPEVLANYGSFWGGVAAVIALLVVIAFSRMQYQQSRAILHYQMMLEYYRDGDDNRQREARKAVYESLEGKALPEDKAETVVAFFHQWGILAQRGAIPIDVFVATVTGDRVIKLRGALESFMGKRDKEYGAGFRWLVDTVERERKRRRIQTTSDNAEF